QHVPATIVHRPARARAEVVDQELLLAHDPVFAPVCPEAPELRICPQAREQIVRHRRDRVVPTQALVQGGVSSLMAASSSRWNVPYVCEASSDEECPPPARGSQAAGGSRTTSAPELLRRESNGCTLLPCACEGSARQQQAPSGTREVVMTARLLDEA